MIPNFEWDVDKARANQRKHGVSFEEAAMAFSNDDGRYLPDILHSVDEDRFIIIAMSHRQRLLVVCYTLRGENVRIISARSAESHEKRIYETKNRSS